MLAHRKGSKQSPEKEGLHCILSNSQQKAVHLELSMKTQPKGEQNELSMKTRPKGEPRAM